MEVLESPCKEIVSVGSFFKNQHLVQTPAEVDKWTLPFGTVIDNPLLRLDTDDTDNQFKNGLLSTICSF